MTYHIHQIDSKNHKDFLDQQRRDPITHQPISAGNSVVICAVCKGAFLESSWKFIDEEHCEQSNTLRTIQTLPSNWRFSSKKAQRRNFRVDNKTSATSTYVPSTPAPPGRNLNIAVAIGSGAFVGFIGLIFISVIAILAVKFGFSGNNSATVAFANNSNNRIYSNNSTVNRNSPVYANTNKAANANIPTKSPLSCRLYNDKSYENKVFIRSDCDVYDCDTDMSRVIDSLPDNTPINIIKSVSRIKSNVKPYYWIKVEIIDTGQIVWVADSKIKCD